MAGLEFQVGEDTDAGRIMRWRLEELQQAGYEDAAALAIDLLRRGCPPALAARILL